MYIHNLIASFFSSSALSMEESEYSCPTWKRVPTTTEVVFGLALPYRPPSSTVGAFLWRKRVWLESTFALTMLQPWEKLVLFVFFHSVWLLFLTALIYYSPRHYAYLLGRSRYYLFGQEADATVVLDVVSETLAGWSSNASSARIHVDL